MMFSPNRLMIARKRRKLTKKELAQRAHLSYVTLTRLEQRGNPDKDTIKRLSRALDFPMSFFYADDLDELGKDSASFRSMKAMTARERDAALSAASLAFVLSDWVDERFGLPVLDLPDFEYGNAPELVAERLRLSWRLSDRPLANVIKLLESKGIRVFSLCEDTRNVDAFSCWRNGIPYIFLNTYKTAERSRFDALHELGHLMMHRHIGTKGREAEHEANQFASAFLLPLSSVCANIKLKSFISLEQVIQLKKIWGVSAAALSYRLHKLERISDWQYRSFNTRLTENFKNTEPEGMARERSYIWDTVFRQLWQNKMTKRHIAEELSLPISELENLVFGSIAIPPIKKEVETPSLQLVG